MGEQLYTYKYPHAAITTDSVVFGYADRKLHILLIERKEDPFQGKWALPGGFLDIKKNETLEECARRELIEETQADIYMEQFYAFSAPNRDPRERVITIAFLALVHKNDFKIKGGTDARTAAWFDVDQIPELAFDHSEIIKKARLRLQEKLRTEPIAFNLLNKQFAMSELQGIYELINGCSYDRRNFCKKMTKTGLVKDVTPQEIRTSNRIPLLYEFDADAYQTYIDKGERKYPFDF